MPKVSVVICTYNRAHFIAESIQSVLDQTFADFEIIVVDDGSTDNTKEAVDSFQDPRIRYVYQENRGLSAARNTGIRTSIGEYISFLDSDDIWLPQNLELMVKRLDSRPDVAFVCSDLYFFDDATGAILGRVWHNKRSDNSVNPKKAARCALRYLLQRGCFITAIAMVVRREVFTEVGYFDESLINHVDWDLFVRIVQRFPIVTMDMPLAKNRHHHGERMTNVRRELFYQGALVVLDKAIRSYSLSRADLRLVRRRLARTHFRYGRDLVANGGVDLGREKLLIAIKVNPWCIRPYIYIAGSFFGGRAILAVKSWKKQLKHHLLN
jgi:glycosyltransferase involved in cell wall biosynthesis